MEQTVYQKSTIRPSAKNKQAIALDALATRGKRPHLGAPCTGTELHRCAGVCILGGSRIVVVPLLANAVYVSDNGLVTCKLLVKV